MGKYLFVIVVSLACLCGCGKSEEENICTGATGYSGNDEQPVDVRIERPAGKEIYALTDQEIEFSASGCKGNCVWDIGGDRDFGNDFLKKKFMKAERYKVILEYENGKSGKGYDEKEIVVCEKGEIGVMIKAPSSIKKGETEEISVSLEGGKPPYKIHWIVMPGEAEGYGESVVVNFDSVGLNVLKVSIVDSEGKMSEQIFNITVI